MEWNLPPYQNNKRPPYSSLNHKTSPSHVTTPNPTRKIGLVSSRRPKLPPITIQSLLPHSYPSNNYHHLPTQHPQLKQSPSNPVQTFSQSQILFRSNECNKAAPVRHAASPKQIESSMTTSANQLNLVNLVQTPMYSFMLLNIARLFTKSKPKFFYM